VSEAAAKTLSVTGVGAGLADVVSLQAVTKTLSVTRSKRVWSVCLKMDLLVLQERGVGEHFPKIL
jgi:hypothetical protein